MRVLAIESSCDESAAAVLDAHGGLLSHELFSQVELHRTYGAPPPMRAICTASPTPQVRA